MRRKFSTAWKGSKQVRKQRKYVAKAPLHIKRKMLSSHLSKELRKKYERRSFQLRKNDVVKVMIGEFVGKSGKVSVVDSKNSRVAIEGIQETKKDGSKVNVWFNCSNIMITELNMEDKKRLESIKRGKEQTKTEQKMEKK